MEQPCLARLTDFFKTRVRIGASKSFASIAYVCQNDALQGEDLCESCLNRTTESRYKDGKYHGRNVHGLVTDAIPEDSHIYGSVWYEDMVEKFGHPDDIWLEQAIEADELVKDFANKILVMKGRSKNKLPEVVPESAKITNKFQPITQLYQESDKQPEKLPTDSMKATKEKINGEMCWVTEMGHIFGIEKDGSLGVYKGKRDV
jgi:hypothetical protein